MKSSMKIFAGVFGLLCVVSAGLQYNDPDPLLWIIIYGVTALVSFGVASNKLPYSVPLVLAILFLVGGIYLFPETFEGFEIGKGSIENVEEGRESVGLFILSLAMFFFALRLKKS